MVEEGEGEKRVYDLSRVHPFAIWRKTLEDLAVEQPDIPLPPFIGGLAGYLGYEISTFFDRVPRASASILAFPDAVLMVVDTLLVFDHVTQTLSLFTFAAPGEEQPAQARLRALTECLMESGPLRNDLALSPPPSSPPEWTTYLSSDRFCQMVERAKEYIAAGDAFQIVLSRRWGCTVAAPPLAIYRALRRLNPSPYLFFMDLPGSGLYGEDLALIGSSPEMLVRVKDREATVRPIAGTRRRGRTPEEDQALESELRDDIKERAEHVMLVDLGRNDLGRVCNWGSVRVDELMVVERYSHVMHLVSTVRGQLRPECDAFDALAATFPAGTVSGAPKVRAMEIIAELEGEARGPYAGGVGYFDIRGNADWCITIRTVLMQGDRAFVQAGAGIVADSVPEREAEETWNKARAMMLAVDQSHSGISGD